MSIVYQIKYDREYFKYLEVAKANGITETKYRQRLRSGHTHENAAKEWEGTVPQRKYEKEEDIRSYFRYNMPMKKEYLEYLNDNPEFYSDMVSIFGYTDQLKGILNKTYISI
ncbi:hypothetical protein [Macrococcus armenti]|uniref:hypothetical protein n=1 Tax=Macrococcus armenti TaxID=2875764 RepID=UPI001CD340DB|nr:hypothetical protein [Macrococcus armenti]UBH10625.1 hypothetical protein LAU38_10360 [Macrococcus armenti]